MTVATQRLPCENVLPLPLAAPDRLGRSLVMMSKRCWLFRPLYSGTIAICAAWILRTNCARILRRRGSIDRPGSLYGTSYLIQSLGIAFYYPPTDLLTTVEAVKIATNSSELTSAMPYLNARFASGKLALKNTLLDVLQTI